MTASLRDYRAQLTLAAVLLILGFLLVVQLRSQSEGSALERLSTQDLTLLVANVNARNDQLRVEVADLESQLARVRAAAGSGEQSASQLRADTSRDRIWSGLAAAQGPGVRIEVAGRLPGSAVQDLLNELRNAGAEAIAVSGIRVVASTVAIGDPGAVTVDGVPLTDPFALDVLGDPNALAGSLTRAGGIIALFAATFPEVRLTVIPRGDLVLPATTRDLAPAHGAPGL
ncbi:MAG: DUF881 domain-containing protein [Chloroflexota bacterium]